MSKFKKTIMSALGADNYVKAEVDTVAKAMSESYEIKLNAAREAMASDFDAELSLATKKMADSLTTEFQAAITIMSDSFGTAISGQSVSLDKSMRVSAVWACVRLISETVSTLPVKVYQKQSDGSRIEAKDHQLYEVLCREPNRVQTPAKMLEFLVACLCIKGNAYFEKKMIGKRLIALIPILPQSVTDVKLLDSGRYEYTINSGAGKEQKLLDDKIWHIRGFGTNGVLGDDVFGTGREVIGAALASNETAYKFFESGLSSSGFLSTDKVLNPDQRKKIGESLNRFNGSKNAGKSMVLEAGMSYHGISINPEQAQLLQTRGYDVEEICRLFKVPPVLVGFMSKQSSWASSLEALNQQFLTYTLMPIIRNIEQSITKSLLDPVERDVIYAEFSYEGFLRADSKSRTEFYKAMVDIGAMNRDEVRKKENLPPMAAGGDIHTVQSALIPIEKVGANYEKAQGTE
jgi:HK97 family phage portal protein